MQYLCLAYGSEKDWKALRDDEQDALLAQDEVLRQRGALVAAVDLHVKTVRSPAGIPISTDGAFAKSGAPLAGFCILEARDLEEAIDLVAQTPCARANGAIELRPITQMNETHVRAE
jgi:hypothetical protein